MQTAAPKGGGGESDRKVAGLPNSTTSAAAVQVTHLALRILRARLVGARRRLIERLVDDYPPDRRFPDSGWTRMLADIHVAIAAVDAVMDEAGGGQ